MSNYKTKETMFINPQHTHYEKYHWIDVISFQLIRKETILNCLHIKNKASVDLSSVMIYAQDEGNNLGTSLSFLFDLSSYHKMSIITFEYTNLRNNEDVAGNINHLYLYLTKVQAIKRIIMFGFSIGVYAVVSVIQANDLNKVESIILLSPNWNFSPDLLRSRNKVSVQLKKSQRTSLSSIDKPILLIHGKKDAFIKYMISYQMRSQIASLTEWYPENGEHWNIHIVNRTKLYKKIAKFMKSNQGENKNASTMLSPTSNIEPFTPNLFLNSSFKQGDNHVSTNDKIISIEGKNVNVNDISLGLDKSEHTIGDEKDYYQTFKEGDIIPTNSSYKMNNDPMISSYKKNNDYNHSTNQLDQGFSFTQKPILRHNGNFNISN